MQITEITQILVPLLLAVWLVVTGIIRARFMLKEHERLVVFRLGRAVRIEGPGRAMLIPYIEQGRKFDISDEFNARLVASFQMDVERAGRN